MLLAFKHFSLNLNADEMTSNKKEDIRGRSPLQKQKIYIYTTGLRPLDQNRSNKIETIQAQREVTCNTTEIV